VADQASLSAAQVAAQPGPPSGASVAEVDVVVAGAGPAALALGAACHAAGLDVCTVGPVGPWTATYGVWIDELDDQMLACVREPSTIEVVVAEPSGRGDGLLHRLLPRTYGVLDNDRLQRAIGTARHVDAIVTGVVRHGDHHVVDTSAGRLRARLVVDATGAAPRLMSASAGRASGNRAPAQTAYGVVLGHRPALLGGSGSILMDWRQPPGHHSAASATFLYVLSLGGGRWLVEETSLARRPAVGHDELRARLASRLGEDPTERAEHIELVTIPMAPGAPRRSQPVVGFGAAAGYVHPATGYSVSASLRAAPRVAGAIVAALDADVRTRSLQVWDAVWPSAYRRSRALHDFGLAALLRMAPDELGRFFGAFFDLPSEQWSAYLRVDVEPAEVVRAMRSVFTALPWSMRARLVAGSPLPLVRSLR
jgi:lycopene beta-cyclase